MKLWVNVCFHYVEKRVKHFYKLIENLKSVDAKFIINSDINFDNTLPIDVAILSNPYYLTWEHKKYMQKFLDSDYTHFAYLEGNVEITKKNLDYWESTKEIFEKNNLNFIPGLHRVQIVNGQTYSLDCTRQVSKIPSLELEGKKFISLPEPYQGMFIMDKQMVKEHIQSEYFIIGQKGWWGIRESANLGNTFVNVLNGFNHRVLMPLDNFEDTLIPHFGTNYHSDPMSPHAKIKIENLFV
jgi:hypothetical protein